MLVICLIHLNFKFVKRAVKNLKINTLNPLYSFTMNYRIAGQDDMMPELIYSTLIFIERFKQHNPHKLTKKRTQIFLSITEMYSLSANCWVKCSNLRPDSHISFSMAANCTLSLVVKSKSLQIKGSAICSVVQNLGVIWRTPNLQIYIN